MTRIKQGRIERRGAVEPLTPRVVKFLEEALSGQSLDSKESSEQLRPDYICLDGQLAIEIKTLKEDGKTRLDNLTDNLRLREDWPQMMGSAPLQSVLKNMPDAEHLQKKALDRIGRAIVDHIRKANSQLRAYAENSDQKNLVKVLILVNEDHEIYEPRVAQFTIHKALKRQKDGKFSYADVDAVLYLTERHAIAHNNTLVFPLLCIEGSGMENAIWKRQIIEQLVGRWWEWIGYSVAQITNSTTDFATIEHIPDKMGRQDKWELDYRRQPYMEHFTEEQLRNIFDELALNSLLAFHKKSPQKPSREETTLCMQRMSHMRVEITQRGIPVTKFCFEPQRTIAAANRMRLSKYVVDWLEQTFCASLT